MNRTFPLLLLLLVATRAAAAPAAIAQPSPPARVAPPSTPAEDEDEKIAREPPSGGPASRRTGEWSAKPSGKKVTLEGTMTLDQALGKIADAGGWNLVATSGAEGGRSLTLRLRRIPVEDALEAVLQGTSLVAARHGALVTVVPGRPGDGSIASVVAEANRSAAEASKSAKEIGREIRRKLREQKREQRAQRGGAGNVVGRGDQLIKAGEPADDVVVIGGSVRLEPKATAQDIVAVLGAVELGPGAVASGDVVAVGGDVHLMQGAHVMGDVSSVGGKVITDEGAIIDGERTGVDVPGLAQLLTVVGARGWSPHPSSAVSFATLLVRFAVFFGLAMLLMSIAPRRVENLAVGLSNAPLKTAITGVLGTLAMPLAAILLAVTVIGIPLIAVLVLGILVSVVMGYSALALFIGRALPLPAARARTVLQLALGTAAIVLLGTLPVLGWMVWVTGWLFVVGVVVRTRLGQPARVAPPPIHGTIPPPMPPIEPPVPPSSVPPAPPAPPTPPAPPAPGMGP
jgi:hypothetical protein